MNNIYYKFIFFLSIIFLYSCQPTKEIKSVVFDNNKLAKITINAESKLINNIYESQFVEPYIDHSLKLSPIFYFRSWANQNIQTFGNENKFIINIIEASMKKTEIDNNDKKRYSEKTIFLYEIFYLIEYKLHNDSDELLASTKVEGIRSKTSSKFISLIESENIIDSLILDCLIDLTKTSKVFVEKHMSQFVL